MKQSTRKVHEITAEAIRTATNAYDTASKTSANFFDISDATAKIIRSAYFTADAAIAIAETAAAKMRAMDACETIADIWDDHKANGRVVGSFFSF